MWYAYRLDILDGGGTPMTLAVGCKGTWNGLCYFDELLQYLQRGSQPWSKPSGVGKNLDPDVLSTAKSLRKDGFAPNWDVNKIFGQGTFASASPGIDLIMTPIVDRIQAIRSSPPRPPVIDPTGIINKIKLQDKVCKFLAVSHHPIDQKDQSI